MYMPPAPTHSSPLSLHDALPIWPPGVARTNWTQGPTSRYALVPETADAKRLSAATAKQADFDRTAIREGNMTADNRSEEHTSELQSLRHLVCRLLLEKKKKTKRQ